MAFILRDLHLESGETLFMASAGDIHALTPARDVIVDTIRQGGGDRGDFQISASPRRVHLFCIATIPARADWARNMLTTVEVSDA